MIHLQTVSHFLDNAPYRLNSSFLSPQKTPSIIHTTSWQISTNGIARQDPLTLTVCEPSANKLILVSAPHGTMSGPHLALSLEQTASAPILTMNLKQTVSAAHLAIKLVTSSQQTGEIEIVSPGGQELSAILVMPIPLPQMMQQSCGSTLSYGGKS
jgi:hypothetical protein